jgi:anti-anti-sigma factor
MMDIRINEHTLRIAVVAPRTTVDAFTAPQLREKLVALIDDGVMCFVIDLSDVPFMDSAGMAVLVTTLKRARTAGGNVKLVWPKLDAAQRILKLTRFDQVFDMAANADEALGQWKKA